MNDYLTKKYPTKRNFSYQELCDELAASYNERQEIADLLLRRFHLTREDRISFIRFCIVVDTFV